MKNINEVNFKRWYVDVKRGRYSIRMVADLSLRVAIENKMIEEYVEGTLGETGTDALIQWKLVQIHNNAITLDEVDERIRSLIKDAIDNNVEVRLI